MNGKQLVPILSVLLLLLLSGCARRTADPGITAPSAQPAPAVEGTAGLPSLAVLVAEVIAPPAQDLDLAPTLFRLGRLYDPLCDIGKYQQQLDDLAAELQKRLAGKTDPQAIVQTINTYLFEDLGYSSSSKVLPAVGNYVFHQTLRDKSGPSQNVAILYACLGEKLNLPLYVVVVPDHYLARYDDGQTRINIETTEKGQSWTDEEYRQTYRLPSTGSAARFYFSSLGKRQVMARFLTHLGMGLRSDPEKWEEAMEVYHAALRLNPGDPLTLCSLGSVLSANRKSDEAMESYRAALAIDPEDPGIHASIAWQLREQGKLDEAIREFRAALRLDPNRAPDWYELGCIYSQEKKLPQEAIRCYQKYLELNPEAFEAQAIREYIQQHTR